MSWTFTSDAPIYLQAAEIIKLRILKGEYPPGGGIPSVRDLAQEAAVNPNTMQKALSLLESEELLTTQRTAGRKVTESADLIQLVRVKQAKRYVAHCKEQLAALGFSAEEAQKVLKKELFDDKE
ncbi:MAG: GntR family transcriptional regulator [Oscillospiraceae bacterium]|nr:GntR family transcriptional regulator [Oscillospiraceae bacterium]MBR1845716.1 GntR family transcriptional regulator [Oscillospiraceae bacterium]